MELTGVADLSSGLDQLMCLGIGPIRVLHERVLNNGASTQMWKVLVVRLAVLGISARSLEEAIADAFRQMPDIPPGFP